MEKEPEHIGMGGRRPTILIADDTPEIQDFLKDMLEEHGYPVEVAADGREALEKCASGSIDIVIADIKMPGLDGLELTRRLKALYPRIEVIVITGYSSMESAIEALRSGAFDYITKPLYPDMFLHSVKMAAERHQWSVQQDALIRVLSETNEALRVQRERTLKTDRLLQTVVAHLFPPFLVIDPDLRVAYASPKLLHELGKDRDVVETRKITELFPSSFSELLDRVRRVFRTGSEERVEIDRGAGESYTLVPLKHGTEWVENVVMVQNEGYDASGRARDTR